MVAYHLPGQMDLFETDTPVPTDLPHPQVMMAIYKVICDAWYERWLEQAHSDHAARRK